MASVNVFVVVLDSFYTGIISFLFQAKGKRQKAKAKGKRQRHKEKNHSQHTDRLLPSVVTRDLCTEQ